jgi:hypothetical protein
MNLSFIQILKNINIALFGLILKRKIEKMKLRTHEIIPQNSNCKSNADLIYFYRE